MGTMTLFFLALAAMFCGGWLIGDFHRSAVIDRKESMGSLVIDNDNRITLAVNSSSLFKQKNGTVVKVKILRIE